MIDIPHAWYWMQNNQLHITADMNEAQQALKTADQQTVHSCIDFSVRKIKKEIMWWDYGVESMV